MSVYGKWETLKELGRGGQGAVYLSQDTTRTNSTGQKLESIRVAVQNLAGVHTPEDHHRHAELLTRTIAESVLQSDPANLGALKLLHQPASDESTFEKAKERMAREVAALAKITHPNVLKILDQNLKDAWFVGEYHSHGPILNHPVLYKGNILAAVTAFRPLVEGVAALHEAKIVHRDIKPGNVFLSTDKRLVLGDLGLVLFTDASHARVTESYENVGTRDWMPAWAMSMRLEEVRPSFDVFGLGKLLWAMLSGRTFLRLWYLHDDAFKLENIFPDNESMRWARIILDKCIVEHERNCLKNAGELLRLIDEILPAIERHAQLLGEKIVRRCDVCGLGTYERIVNEDIMMARNFGLNPTGMRSFKIFTCSHCGHVQLFHFLGGSAPRPNAWGK